MTTFESRVDEDTPEGIRLDRYLSEVTQTLTRSQLKNRVLSIQVNGKPAKLSKKLTPGDEVRVDCTDEIPITFEPENIPLDILYEDDDIIVVNKPQGMVVHPAAGNFTGTLVQGLMYRYTGFSTEFDGDLIRPGIVHRLDKDTSGVIIAAKGPQAQKFIADQFRKKRTKKVYLAIAKGFFSEPEGEIRTLLGRDPKNRKKFTWMVEEGKESVTGYRVLRQYEYGALVALYPETGRTHQLRVHLLSIGHPILGDPIYGRKDRMYPDSTLMLHAYRLTVKIPSQEDPVTFHAPVPDHLKKMVISLSKDGPV